MASLRFVNQQQALFIQTDQPLTVEADSQTEESPAPGSIPATEPAVRARENLIHALLNHSDFITVR